MAGGPRLHYIERGKGQPVVFLHGNGAMVEDMLISKQFTRRPAGIALSLSTGPGSVTAPDHGRATGPRRLRHPSCLKPFGCSASSGRSWSVIRGERWWRSPWRSIMPGMLRMVLASGYYYPTPRKDVALFSARDPGGRRPDQAHRGAPDWRSDGSRPHRTHVLAARGVAAVCRAVPSRTHSAAISDPGILGNSAHMISAAEMLSSRYRSLFPPTAILAGDADEIVSYRQGQKLHGEVAGSRLEILRGGSHMIHHIAPERIVHAIDAVAAESSTWRPQAN